MGLHLNEVWFETDTGLADALWTDVAARVSARGYHCNAKTGQCPEILTVFLALSYFFLLFVDTSINLQKTCGRRKMDPRNQLFHLPTLGRELNRPAEPPRGSPGLALRSPARPYYGIGLNGPKYGVHALLICHLK